jgi:transposase
MEDFIKNECGITLTSTALGAVFMTEGSHLRKIRSKAQNKPQAAHRPPVLTKDEESAVIRLIRDGYNSGNYVTQRNILNFVESQFQKCLTYRWVEYFLQRHVDIVCKKTLAP